MRTKKVLISLMLVAFVLALFSSTAMAEHRRSREVQTVGVLSYLGTDPETFQEKVNELGKMLTSATMRAASFPGMNDTIAFLNSFRKSEYEIKFYDSLTNMVLALDAEQVKVISIPEYTARYLMRNDPDYLVLFTILMPSSVSFGFRSDKDALRDEFNKAIRSMKEDGTLKALEEKYITNPESEPEAVAFEKFDGADKITIAVTGDIPPIDYIAANGSPAGYNTAVLSEIGRRLHKNVEVLSIEAGARSSSLVSGKADVIFWYRSTKGIDTSIVFDVDNPLTSAMNDVAEGILLSEPYYEWQRNMLLTF